MQADDECQQIQGLRNTTGILQLLEDRLRLLMVAASLQRLSAVQVPIAQSVETTRDHDRRSTISGDSESLLRITAGLAIIAGGPDLAQIEQGFPFAATVTQVLKETPALFDQCHATVVVAQGIGHQPHEPESLSAVAPGCAANVTESPFQPQPGFCPIPARPPQIPAV